ncbi:MAG: esterase-like activity of phytase family protein [Geminicoccaceae bacterium]
MRRYLPLLFATSTLAALPALAQEMVEAELVGHAYIPADTFAPPPADAPQEAWISAKFRDPAQRIDEPYSSEPVNGFRYPFLGQPLQGISGYAAERAEDGSIYALIDNGFGAKNNSPDALLSYMRIAPDFESGEIEVLDRVWLHDPDKIVPFRIIHETTEERYLTGGDFDLESIQVVGDTVWIGEEFGPFLISATLDGRVTGVYPTVLDGEELSSPDRAGMRSDPRAGEHFNVPRSGGYEGMALTPDGGLLWAMLEKPLIAENGENEGEFLRVLAFDPAARAWTGDSFKFALTEGAAAIGDFNFIDDSRALVIERDGGQGDPSLGCPEGETEGCFETPAEVKRITLIDTGQIDEDGFVSRVAQIDLMEINDPKGVARLETDGEVPDEIFTFPFVTIESVILDGDEHIIVGNDNNLPGSAGRKLGSADNNEMIRLHVPALLASN